MFVLLLWLKQDDKIWGLDWSPEAFNPSCSPDRVVWHIQCMHKYCFSKLSFRMTCSITVFSNLEFRMREYCSQAEGTTSPDYSWPASPVSESTKTLLNLRGSLNPVCGPEPHFSSWSNSVDVPVTIIWFPTALPCHGPWKDRPTHGLMSHPGFVHPHSQSDAQYLGQWLFFSLSWSWLV